jgi:heme O synthase-like polyprenyltransferase
VGKFAPGKSRPNRDRILGIGVAVLVLEVALLQVFPESLAITIVAVLAGAVLIWISVEKWLEVDRRAALKVAGAYTAARLLLALLLGLGQGLMGGTSG